MNLFRIGWATRQSPHDQQHHESFASNPWLGTNHGRLGTERTLMTGNIMISSLKPMVATYHGRMGPRQAFSIPNIMTLFLDPWFKQTTVVEWAIPPSHYDLRHHDS